MNSNNILEIPITIYGNLEKYSDTLSKGRCATFYKYKNRNGSFITDEFAEKLISTVPYAPVKGIYDELNEDYTDHGESRNLGRIYGVVPENPNFAWETRLDPDGVEREYACVDVLIYTALYEETGDIIGKAQSMELYGPSIKGEWQVIDGQKYFVFTDGCFLGLQVLGEDVEPCFEGAGFFQLMDRMEQLMQRLDSYQFSLENSNNGGNDMFEINFKLSDNAKANQIWSLLNPNFTEEGNWTLDYGIEDIYDDYVLAYSCEKRKHYRVYYTKDNEAESVTLGEMVEVYIVDVTATEKQTLETIQKINNGTYENLDNVFNTYNEIEEKVSNLELKITEQENAISTLNTEKEELTHDNEELTSSFASLQDENNSLKEYKITRETEDKNAVIDKYAAQLDEEIIANYRERVSEFELIELDKELAYKLVLSKPTVFSIDNSTNILPVDDDADKDDLSSILEKYRK